MHRKESTKHFNSLSLKDNITSSLWKMPAANAAEAEVL
jgi:hypothetical protein